MNSIRDKFHEYLEFIFYYENEEHGDVYQNRKGVILPIESSIDLRPSAYDNIKYSK